MIILVILLVVFVFLVPVGLMTASAWWNLKHDSERFASYRRALGPGFWGRAVLGTFNAVASTGFIGATYLLGRLPWKQGGGEGAPVLLVHGLYHNPSAWLAFRRVLKREGFTNIHTYGYGSFTTTYADLVHGLGQAMERVLAENPGAKLALVGHSLGGLLIRGAMADERFAGRIGAVATLGTPHQGSELAALGIGRLARSLHPSDPIFDRLAKEKPVSGVRCLSLFTPLDNMVFPVRCLELPESQREAWQEEPRRPDVSHVGLVYDRGMCARVVEHLRAAADEGAFSA